ncbi:MAG: glycosyltransferase family 2 protein [Tannerella sp.]|jgi:glycosyltransferase involved in cell wall biosynthesis|nr:glycosyltransferase family 2 protein [Tannerella sp.]
MWNIKSFEDNIRSERSTMGRQPVISVIMPVYNGEKYIRESVHSILNQSYRDFEFIIIDDGSTDNTRSILHSCRDTDDRINLTLVSIGI